MVSSITTAACRVVYRSDPVKLSAFRALEIISSVPLGDAAITHPMTVVRSRQISWLCKLANTNDLTGWLHRGISVNPMGGLTPEWRETSVPLAAAMKEYNLAMVVNRTSLMIAEWPTLRSEPQFKGEVITEVQPEDPDPLVGCVVYTDGSLVGSNGGAAAVNLDSGESKQLQVNNATSSSHCEMVALIDGLSLNPDIIYTDSLTSLRWIQGWGKQSLKDRLNCADRDLVRKFIVTANRLVPHLALEKVKGHDEAGLRIGSTKAKGNDSADHLAGEARTCGRVFQRDPRFMDPALLCAGKAGGFAVGGTHSLARMADLDLTLVTDHKEHIRKTSWNKNWDKASKRRPWLKQLYNVDIDWSSSNFCFKNPVVANKTFIYKAEKINLKWPARVRSGALATRERLMKSGISDSPTCICCNNGTENEEHVLFTCPVTGAASWESESNNPLGFRWAWDKAMQKVKSTLAIVPTATWVQDHRWALRAGIIPASIDDIIAPLGRQATTFKKELHLYLITTMGDIMRRRGEKMSTKEPPPSSTNTRPKRSRPSTGPGETRQSKRTRRSSPTTSRRRPRSPGQATTSPDRQTSAPKRIRSGRASTEVT
jgi:ribonuclease HI